MTINFNTNQTYNKFFKQAGITTTAKNETQTNNNITENKEKSVASVKVGNIADDNKNKRQLFGIIGISAGSILLLGIIAISLLSKGFSGNLATKFREISEKAREKVLELTSQTKNLSITQKIKLRFNKSIQQTAEAMQASSNISALKDSFTLHWLKKLKMEKIIDKINHFFKKITLKTKNQSYQNAEYSVVEFSNYLKTLASQYPKTKESAELTEKADSIIKQYMEHFSSSKHIQRSNETWNSLKNLHEEVYGKLFKEGFWKNFKSLRSYVTTDLIAERRENIHINNIIQKSKISNSLGDVETNFKQAFFKLIMDIKPGNNEAINAIKEISKLLNKNKTLKGIDESQKRKELFEIIKQELDKLCSSVDNKHCTKHKIENLKRLLSPESYRKGLVQEALTEIKELFGGKNSEIYKHAQKLAGNLNKKINNALTQENIVYEKLAEMQVGSAATDVVGILAPTALATFLIVDAKDKNERITKTLTQGIPIFGGIATTYYGTTRGFTGFKNLALGLSTGYLLNILGTETDKLVKKYMVEQEKLKKAFESFTKMQKNIIKQEKVTNTAKPEPV